MSDITQKPSGVLWTPDGPRDMLQLHDREGTLIHNEFTDQGNPAEVRMRLMIELVYRGIINQSAGDCGVTVTFPDGATSSGKTVEEALKPYVRL